MKIAAVIFDLNGTILEDEDEYSRAFIKVLKSLGVTATDAESHTKGIGVKENWPLLIQKFNIKTDKTPEMLAKETQDAYLSDITSISVRPGFLEFVRTLKNNNISIAIATSNTWEVADSVLNKTLLEGIVETVTTTEEVAHNKPSPDLLILTADKLGADRSECLVIEDSASGIEAAHRGGMKVVGIISDENSTRELKNADLVVRNFSEITLQAIDSL